MDAHQAVFLILLLIFLFLIRKNTSINLFLLAFSIPFESYVYWKIGFTLKPAQLFAVTTLISMVLNRDRVLRPLHEFVPFLLIVSAAALSLVNAPWELVTRGYQGSVRMIFNLALLCFIAYTLSISIKNCSGMKKVMLSYIAGVSVSILLEFYFACSTGWDNEEYIVAPLGLHYSLHSGYLRLSPYNIQPNMYAAVLFISLTFISILYVNRIHLYNILKYLLPVSFILGLYAFILTFSRGPWISYLLALLIILWLAKDRKPLNWLIYGSVCLFAVLVMILKIYPLTPEPVVERARLLPIYNVIFGEFSEYKLKEYKGELDDSSLDRLGRWRASTQKFLSHPVIGNGWASDPAVHSVPLQILSESGIVGMGAFLFFSVSLLLRLLKSIRISSGEARSVAIGVMAALIGYTSYLMTDIGLYQIQTWFLVGLGLSIARMNDSTEPVAPACAGR